MECITGHTRHLDQKCWEAIPNWARKFLKHDFDVQGRILVLYRTKFGLRLMDRISKTSPRLLRVIGIIGVVIGFLGMVSIFYILLK